jgi:hypothetical protein
MFLTIPRNRFIPFLISREVRPYLKKNANNMGRVFDRLRYCGMFSRDGGSVFVDYRFYRQFVDSFFP